MCVCVLCVCVLFEHRYVLLCREIHSSLAKSMSLLEESDPYFSRMNEVFLNSKKVSQTVNELRVQLNKMSFVLLYHCYFISQGTQHCNTSIRIVLFSKYCQLLLACRCWRA